MALNQPPQRGLSAPVVTSIPTEWSAQWFRGFISNYLQPADVRNALVPASGGVVVTTAGGPSAPATITLASIPNDTVFGNISGVTAPPTAITQTQLTALINQFSATAAGDVPATGGVDATHFLNAVGAWAVPPGATPGNPTAVVGLTAVNGVAATYMRSDAAPALDVSISPTWTGNHTFNGQVLVGAATGGFKGAGTVNATGLFVNGTAVSTATGANPTANVGLAAVNGASANFMRADAAPALDVTISPTWTGNHTFQNTVNVTATNAGQLGYTATNNSPGTGATAVVQVTNTSNNASLLITSTGYTGTFPGTPPAANLAYLATTGANMGIGTTANTHLVLCTTATGLFNAGINALTQLTFASAISAGVTGGNKGAGTLNCAGVYVNGVAVGGGSLTVTDGTHSVTGTTTITVSGAVVSGTSPSALITIGSSPAAPLTVPDLLAWWASDNINQSAGGFIQQWENRVPWQSSLFGYSTTTQATKVASITLNSLPVLDMQTPMTFYANINPTRGGTTGCTYFVVFQPHGSFASNYVTLIGGAGGGGGLALYMSYSNGLMHINNSGTVSLADSTTVLTAGTWYQANVTYNAVNGAYAFRLARAANGSGTTNLGVGTGNIGYIGSDQGSNGINNFAYLAEVIIYDGVLTSGQITTIENYLNSKWGV